MSGGHGYINSGSVHYTISLYGCQALFIFILITVKHLLCQALLKGEAFPLVVGPV